MIVNFFEASANFELPPEKAIEYFTGKGLKQSYNWYEMLNHDHDISFTVAKMMDDDLLMTVRSELDKAMEAGSTLVEFKRNLIPILQKKGWWGKKDIIDAATGHVSKTQLGSCSRLENIFRTNMQSSYAAGHWQGIQEAKASMPYLMYDAVDDGRTREEHAKYDGLTLPVDDPFWLTHYPLNGYFCRCGVIQMDEDDLIENDLEVSESPVIETYKWTNPTTGQTMKIPNGVDPGFNHNAGMSQKDKIDLLQIEKLAKIAKIDAAAAQKAKVGAAATKAKAEKAKVAKKAKQKAETEKKAFNDAEAQATNKLDIISAGLADKQSSLKMKSLAKAKKKGLDKIMTSQELFLHVTEEAAEAQNKAEKSKALSGYKNKILSGKIPTPKQQSVFDGLDQIEQDNILIDIDVKKAELKSINTAKIVDKPSLDIDKMSKVGGQGGSNPGGTYLDPETGKKYYIKHMDNQHQAKNEVLAAKLYDHAGVDVPRVQYFEQNGKYHVASEVIDDLEQSAVKLKNHEVEGIGDGFAVDAWLANWDVVGLNYDNMLIKGKKVLRLDTGGALEFRAQGTLKGSQFGDKVTELDTFMDKNLNNQSASVFSKLSEEQIAASAARLAKISDQDIANIVNTNGYGSKAQKQALITKLTKRRDYILEKYPAITKAAIKAKNEAIEVIKLEVSTQVSDIAESILTALKGISMRQSKGEKLLPKDLERVLAAEKLLQQFSNDKLIDLTYKNGVISYYQPWINELMEAVQSDKTLSGAQFSVINLGDPKINESLVKYVIPDPKKPEMMNKVQTKKIIEDFGGQYESTSNVPQNGSPSLQSAFSKLSEDHKRAISMYTGHHYDAINEALYLRATTKKTDAFTALLNEALENSTPYKGLSARGMSLNQTHLKRWIEDHKKALLSGKPVKYLSFISSTKGDKAAFGGNVRMIIKGSNGVWVNPISRHAGRENEVLFKSGSTFKVTDIQENINGVELVIYLEEFEAKNVDSNLEFSE